MLQPSPTPPLSPFRSPSLALSPLPLPHAGLLHAARVLLPITDASHLLEAACFLDEFPLELLQPGGVTVCGESLNLGLIDAPVYVFGSREDHIVPWEAAYRNTQVLSGARRKIRFVLGASGHIAGVINPPAKKKRSHWIGRTSALPADAANWLRNGCCVFKTSELTREIYKA